MAGPPPAGLLDEWIRCYGSQSPAGVPVSLAAIVTGKGPGMNHMTAILFGIALSLFAASAEPAESHAPRYGNACFSREHGMTRFAMGILFFGKSGGEKCGEPFDCSGIGYALYDKEPVELLETAEGDDWVSRTFKTGKNKKIERIHKHLRRGRGAPGSPEGLDRRRGTNAHAGQQGTALLTSRGVAARIASE
jgi:hypothetical protein